MKNNEKPTEKLVEYTIESGAVGIPPPHGERGPVRVLLPGATVKLPPRVAARLLLNKARPSSVIAAELNAEIAADKARAEAEAAAVVEAEG